jgi:hypothetical protein
MLLCVIKNITKHLGDDNTPVVIIFELIGGDRWGCKPNDRIHCAGNITVRARQLSAGERIWLNIPELIADGSFHVNNENMQELN